MRALRYATRITTGYLLSPTSIHGSGCLAGELSDECSDKRDGEQMRFYIYINFGNSLRIDLQRNRDHQWNDDGVSESQREIEISNFNCIERKKH